MKKINIVLLLLISTIISGCSKEELSTDINHSSIKKTSKFLSFTQDEYNALKSSLINDFNNSSQNKVNATIPEKELTAKEIANLTVHPIFNMSNVINDDNKVRAKYNKLDNFTSVLDIYHEALLIDKSQLKDFAFKHSNFLVYFEEFNQVMLSMPKYKAALLSPNGLIKIDDKIIAYSANGIKIINDGDEDKIDLLTETNKTNESITVVGFKQSNNRQVSKPGYKVHPQNDKIVLLYTHYLDLDYQFGTTTFFCKIGTEAMTLFNGSIIPVAIFNLNTTNSSIINSANSNCGQNFPNGNYNSRTAYNTAANYTSIDVTVGCVKGFLTLNDVHVYTYFNAISSLGIQFNGYI